MLGVKGFTYGGICDDLFGFFYHLNRRIMARYRLDPAGEFRDGRLLSLSQDHEDGRRNVRAVMIDNATNRRVVLSVNPWHNDQLDLPCVPAIGVAIRLAVGDMRIRVRGLRKSESVSTLDVRAFWKGDPDTIEIHAVHWQSGVPTLLETSVWHRFIREC